MRVEKQNRRSCLALLVILAALAGIILWMSLGGVPGETIADDPKGQIDPVPPIGGPAPAGANTPPPAIKPG